MRRRALPEALPVLPAAAIAELAQQQAGLEALQRAAELAGAVAELQEQVLDANAGPYPLDLGDGLRL